jgi:hypothetical protein
MRRISQLYQDVNVRELYGEQKELVDTENVELTEDEAERILQRTLETIRTEEQKRDKKYNRKTRLFSRKKLGVLLIAAVLLMAFTVNAAERLGLKDELAEFLGVPIQDQNINVQNMISEIVGEEEQNPSVELDGVKITASQAFSDGDTTYIYFDIELPENIYPEDAYLESNEVYQKRVLFHRAKSWIDDREQGGLISDIYQYKDNKNHYYMIVRTSLEDVNTDGDLQKIKAEWQDIGILQWNDGAQWTTLIPGTWTLEWNLDCPDMSQTYEVQKEFAVNRETFTIVSVRLSPLSIKVTAECDNPDEIMDSSTGNGIWGFLMKDGSYQELATVSSVGPVDGKLVFEAWFDELIDPDDIIGVRISGEDVLFRE